MQAQAPGGWREVVRRGDPAEVERLLAKAPRERHDQEAAAALIEAAYAGQAGVLNALLKSGAPASAADRRGWTALMAAVKGNQPEAVDVLLAHGADVHAHLKEGDATTAAALAAELGRTAILERLRRGGGNAAGTVSADIFATAARDGRLDPIKTCLADPAFRVSGEAGERALILAIQAKDIATATTLLDRGADADATGEATGVTPLAAAAATDNVELTRALLARGADPDRKPPMRGSSPLTAAFQAKSEKVALLLVQHDVEIHRPMRNSYPLFYAIGTRMPSLARPLIEAGADVNAVNQEGKTVLMWAVARCHEAVDPVLAAHPRLDQRDHDGRSVFELPEGGAWLADKMRQAGAGAQVDAVLAAPKRSRAELTGELLAAVKKGDARAVKSLLDQGADPQSVNKLEWPVAVLAASRGYTDVLRLLYERDSFVLSQHDPSGEWDVFMEAATNGHTETVRFVLAHAKDAPMMRDRMSDALEYSDTRGHKETSALLREMMETLPPAGSAIPPAIRRVDP